MLNLIPLDKAWCFMWILCLAEDSHEISSLIFSEKQWNEFWILLTAVVIGAFMAKCSETVISGLVILLAVFILSIPSLGTEDVGKAIQWIGIIFFPNYNLGQAHIDMYNNYGYADICEKANYEKICPFIVMTGLNNPCCFPGKNS